MNKVTRDGNGVQFTQRDQQQFKNIVQLYDQRIYKRALKLTDGMLKKYPKQSDLLSMKAFIIGALHPSVDDERHKEAYEYAKEAIKMNVKNPMSWHCLGTLYRGDYEYLEAVKCFKTALKFDKEDAVVLRDLGTCYIQLRNYSGFRDMRNEIKRIRPDVRVNWIASALGNHLCGYINSAINSLVYMDKLGNSDGGNLSSMKNKEEREGSCAEGGLLASEYGRPFSFLEPFQRSELLLYFARVLLDGNKYQQAYDFLVHNKNYILDKTDYYTMVGHLLLKCGLNYSKECKECFSELIRLYPDDDFSLIGCMLSDESLKGVVLPPSNKRIFNLKLTSHQDGFRGSYHDSVDGNFFEEIGVIPLISVSCNFYHKRGTSGIIYYPVFGARSYIGRNEYLRESGLELSSVNSGAGCIYDKKRQVTKNEVLELVVYSEEYLQERRSFYNRSFTLLVEFFEKKKREYPNSDMIRRMEMGVLGENSHFIQIFREYMADKLLNSRITGVRSLLVFVSRLNTSKKALFDKELGKMISEYEERMTCSEAGSRAKEELITLYNIYSQHLDSTGDSPGGLVYIEKSLALDKNRPDTYLIKRRLLRHLYRLDEALQAAKTASRINSSDRYLNVKLICSYLESGEIEKASNSFGEMMNSNLVKTCKQKEKEGSEKSLDLRSLQILWFEKRMAYYSEIYTPENEILALCNYQKAMHSLETMRNDQYDYHLYCLRKITLNRYIEFLNMHDKICCSKQYREISEMYWKRLWLNISRSLRDGVNSDRIRKCQDYATKNKECESALELMKDPDLCWRKSHEIVANYRKDCIYHKNSYLFIYIHYYCSYKLGNRISLETCLFVCLQSIYRLYILEGDKSPFVGNKGTVGSYLVLLVHFSTKLVKELAMEGEFSETKSEEKADLIGSDSKFLVDCILGQFQAISGILPQSLAAYVTDVSRYVEDTILSSALGPDEDCHNEVALDVETLKIIVKISMLNPSLERIEQYLNVRERHLGIDIDGPCHGLFNKDGVLQLVKLLYLRSLVKSGDGLLCHLSEDLLSCSSQAECSRSEAVLFQVKDGGGEYPSELRHFSGEKSCFLNYILFSYDINNRSFVKHRAQDPGRSAVIGNKYARDAIRNGLLDLLDLPILSLVL